MEISSAHGNATVTNRQQAITELKQQMAAHTKHELLKTTGVGSDQASLEVKERPLELVYRAAIEKLNEALESELGPNAIQTASDSGMDFTPEATAERIVSLSTGFYEAFKARHLDEDEAAVFQKFMETIGSGIKQGFEEAKEILDGLGVLEGDIKGDVDTTYELVLEGLKRFEQQSGFV